MMLQVKNCSIIVLCAVLLSAAGCKGKDEPESIIGTAAQPAWTAPAEYDQTTSMTAVVKVDLSCLYTAEQLSEANYQWSADDLLAAFCGETCLGVGDYNKEFGAYWLYIDAPEKGGEVTLKHYSAVLKTIFVATATLPYNNGDNSGTAAKPYTPQWVVAK